MFRRASGGRQEGVRRGSGGRQEGVRRGSPRTQTRHALGLVDIVRVGRYAPPSVMSRGVVTQPHP
eukprot:1187867-Prorocentrum_minimum.AAC.3